MAINIQTTHYDMRRPLIILTGKLYFMISFIINSITVIKELAVVLFHEYFIIITMPASEKNTKMNFVS